MSNANLKRKIRAGIKAGRIDPNYLETRRRRPKDSLAAKQRTIELGFFARIWQQVKAAFSSNPKATRLATIPKNQRKRSITIVASCERRWRSSSTLVSVPR